jgi:ABC-type multidrug transport system fused ATPase/permease subunit
MTIVIITHRLATIRAADLIHVLDAGRLSASGTWDDLMSREQSRLRDLGQLQGLMPQLPVRELDSSLSRLP